MNTDHKSKGSEDFFSGKKDHLLFHDGNNPGRLYREGWHAARRWAEDHPGGKLIEFMVPPDQGKTEAMPYAGLATPEQVKLATGETKKRRAKTDDTGQGSLF